MKCNECNRKIRDSFTDKLQHVMTYHPDRFIAAVSQWPEISRAIGYHIGEQTRKLVIRYATKNLSKEN